MSAPQNHSLAYSELTPNDIIGAVESIDLRCDGRLLALNSYENRVYQVGTEDGAPVVAKFYRPGRWSDATILEEHAFAAELAEAEIPVVAPLAHNGQTLHHQGGFRFAVYPWRGGRAPELDDMKLLQQLGRLVARIHLRGETRDFEHRISINLQSYGIDSAEFLLEQKFIPQDLLVPYQSLCEDLFTGIDACHEWAGHTREIRLHGDFHPGNVLVSGEVLHIVDLDDTCTGPAIQDLWMFLSGNRAEQTPQLDTMLKGYTEFRHFDPQELHLVEALRSLRIMHYAAWLARRWEDPAFKIAFPWFNTQRYWDEHILALREQLALLQEPPLDWMP